MAFDYIIQYLKDCIYALLGINQIQSIKRMIKDKSPIRLDNDEILKQKWKNTQISFESVHKYLVKVKDKKWVLKECLDSVAESVELTRELLEIGLKLTDRKLLDESLFKQTGRKSLDEIDFENMPGELQEKCVARKKLLRYLDRLYIYELILNEYQIQKLSEEDCEENDKLDDDLNDSQSQNEIFINFNVNFFYLFRNMSILESAIYFAHLSNNRALSILMIYYKKIIMSHQLTILSNFPETESPNNYASILPCPCTSQKVEEISDDIKFRDKDWVETCCQQLGDDQLLEDNYEKRFYEENPKFLKYKNAPMTREVLTNWYSDRACEIESLSGIVSNSLDLVKHGINMTLPDLQRLYHDFTIFSMLIYKIDLTDLQFDRFQNLNNFDKVKLLMSKATNDSDRFIYHIKRFLLPFIQLSQKYSDTSSLLHDYLVLVANIDLSLCLKVFENSRLTSNQPDKIINNVYDLIQYAIDCIYSCQNIYHLDTAFAIVECLPERDKTKSDEKLDILQDKVDILEKHLIASDILDKHGFGQPPGHLRDLQMEKNYEETKNLYIKITKNAAKTDSCLTVNKWIELLDDLLEIYHLCFTECIVENEIFEIFVKALLTSERKENFTLAATYMQLNNEIKFKKKVINFEKSLQLIVQAVQDYIDSSHSIQDKNISLAKECINLIDEKEQEKNPQLKEELDFIEALHLIHYNFPIKMLPIQIRLSTQSRLEIIEKAARSSTNSYKKTLNLLKLAKLLRVYNDKDEQFRNGKVLSLIAEIAFIYKDYSHCYTTCQLIMKDELSVGWKICRKLGFCKSFSNDKAKIELLSFALTFCDDNVGSELNKITNEIINIKNKLKI